jgi:hypothetical protein
MNDGGPGLVKYGAAALILGLYASLSAWMVAGEGTAYREAHRKAIASKPEAEPAGAQPEPAPAIVLAPEPKPAPPPAHEPKPVPSSTPHPKPASHPAGPSPEHKPPATHVEPKHRPSTPTPPKAGSAVAKAQPADPFWGEPDQQKVWDLDHLTTQDEQALGAALNRMILHADAEIVNGPLPRRVADAAKPFLAARARKDVDYTFTVLDCPRMNVFSTPGGYIYICRGLFDWIAEDEDYALGYILAHEIYHVDQAHAITCLRDPAVKEKLKLGTVLLFYAVMIPGGYLKQQDLDADKWAAQQMLKAGRSRYETLAFLRRLEDYAKSNGFENKRLNPRDKPDVPLLDNHIRAHPIPRDRLEEVKALIDGPRKN